MTLPVVVFSAGLALITPTLAQTTFQPFGASFASPVTVAPSLSASVLFSGLSLPRGIAFDSQHNLLVVERGFGVTAFHPAANGTGILRTVVLSNPNFTQGIQVDGDKLYLSTANDALVYQYNASELAVSGEPAVLVTGFPAGGELTTHTLQFAVGGSALLIASGPGNNIDPTAREPSSGRSQVRAFPLNASLPSSPLQYTSGALIAYGIRNPAGFAFSPLGEKKLFVVENGASIDNVTGLAASFVNDNPADELNVVSPHSTPYFGFPDCTTMWNGSADPVGDPQYASFARGEQFSLNLEADRDDAWCQNASNNVPPQSSFQAHSVPLDIKFFEGRTTASGFPRSWSGDAFVSFHGSFDRTPPTGYGVIRLSTPDAPNSTYTFLIQASNLTSCPETCIRPVGLAFGKDGRLYVSSDSSGELFVLGQTTQGDTAV
ncbi:soluble quino protein glucose/sorbosone dehydrogenase [Vararia minispora EC-137]|uniref:Soluble quino protein glucose/sorbosone dehydrogenase n=1 Tax=Vararia minispora EC-137 TaxID=1314806 RepID=A0ACB8Q7X0_9AGAM|nr:soluble quino protein glucose/sorbosone dehydrogenase [Vararia minispora EC-137]